MQSVNVLGVMLLACAACAPAPVAAPPGAATPAAAPAAPAASAAPYQPAVPPAPAASNAVTVTDVVARHRAGLDACYAKARAESPNLGRTTVEMTFTIDDEGKPKTVDLKYKHRIEDRAKECMRDTALQLRFPAALQGTQTGTIVFSP
jgi:hypothetical protein